MSKAATKRKECKGCYWENSDRMRDPCVYCSRGIKRVDMYWKGENNNVEETNNSGGKATQLSLSEHFLSFP